MRANTFSPIRNWAEGKGARGHVWITDPDDPTCIDIFAYNPADPHNGPKCTRCGYGFCHHCDEGPQQDCDA